MGAPCAYNITRGILQHITYSISHKAGGLKMSGSPTTSPAPSITDKDAAMLEEVKGNILSYLR